MQEIRKTVRNVKARERFNQKYAAAAKVRGKSSSTPIPINTVTRSMTIPTRIRTRIILKAKRIIRTNTGNALPENAF
jgi:hypothetical protein